ncbi:MAG: hypothetical protein ACR2RE_00580 [Geminicoccaceae bacterium]
MSEEAKRTRGKLTSDGVSIYGPDGLVGELGFGLRKDSEMSGTAAHLAACWNGCEKAGIDDPEAAIPALVEAWKNWIDWMDSPGDGTDKTIEDEEEMLQAMRAALAMTGGGK